MLITQARLVNQTRADTKGFGYGQSLVCVVGHCATFRQGEVAAVALAPRLLVVEADVERVLLIERGANAQTEETILEQRRRIGDERSVERPGVDSVFAVHR